MSSIAKEDSVLKVALSIILLSAFTSILKIETFSIRLNITQIISLLLLFLLITKSVLSKKRLLVLFTDNTSILIYFYLLSNVFSTLFFSPEKTLSVKGCLVILSYVLIYVVVRWAIRSLNNAPFILSKVLKYNYLSAIFGLSSMVLAFLVRKEIPGITFEHIAQSGIGELSSPIPSIQSLSTEPNIFAIITAVLLCLNIASYFLIRKSRKQLFTISILTLSVIFSYTRSVYVALTIALLVILILANRLRLIISMFNYFLILLVIIGSIFIFLPDDNQVKSVLSSRITSLFDFQKGSGLGRVHGLMIGWEGFVKSPIFGVGTLSAETTFYNIYTNEYQEYMGSPGWLNGALIQSLHDTGLVGFLVVLGIFMSILVANFKLFVKLNSRDERKGVVLGFIGGNVILFISSQLSSTLWISFPYIYWGVNMAYISWCKKELFDSNVVNLKS